MRSRFLSLSATDWVSNQQRNKPKEPPKAPEKAPFFLPTLPGVENRFVTVTDPKKDAASEKTSRRLEQAAEKAESVFLQKLHGDDVNGDCKFI